MIRWGILSTARIADRILEGARLAENAEIVAVGSRDLSRAQAYAAEREIARAHGSYEDLLADPEVDAVYIPLPNSMHVEWSIRALEAGKHVLCEKPMARDPAQVERAFDAAERAAARADGGVHVALPRADRGARAARAARSASCATCARRSASTCRSRRTSAGSRELEGGALMDVGCYCVSALRLICGAEPERVSGEQVIRGGGVDARFAGVLRFPGDVLGSFDCGMDVHRRNFIEVVGSEAHDRGAVAVADARVGADPGQPRREPRIEPETVDPYARELEEFGRAVEGGPPPRLGRADAVGQARAIEALYRAADEGRPVTL